MKVAGKTNHSVRYFDGTNVYFSSGVTLKGDVRKDPISGNATVIMGTETELLILKYEMGLLSLGKLTIEEIEGEGFVFKETFELELYKDSKTQKLMIEYLDGGVEEIDELFLRKLNGHLRTIQSKNAMNQFVFHLLEDEYWYDEFNHIIASVFIHKDFSQSSFNSNILKMFLLGTQNNVESLIKTGFSETVCEIFMGKITTEFLIGSKFPAYALEFAKDVEENGTSNNYLSTTSPFPLIRQVLDEFGKVEGEFVINFFTACFYMYNKKIDMGFFETILDVFLEMKEHCETLRYLDYLVKPMFKDGKLTSYSRSVVEVIKNHRDYVKMQLELGFEFDLYPDNLKDIHDDTVTIYNIVMEERRIAKEEEEIRLANLSFEEKIREYAHLTYIGKDYSVLVPKSIEEIIQEGNKLNHCVGSYVTRVKNGLTSILFLRENTDLDKPFMTLEVRNNKLCQAKKQSNSYPSEVEDAFIKEWVRKKQLEFGGY